MNDNESFNEDAKSGLLSIFELSEKYNYDFAKVYAWLTKNKIKPLANNS